jgi:hypothetical protein
MPLNKKSKSQCFCAFLYGVLSVILAMIFAWTIMAQSNFFYGLWHDHGGIAEGIEKYGPQNRYKPGFADTSRQQRIEMFAQISCAIHNNGEGLNDISYSTPTSRGRQKLLHEAEMVHLTDVAHLLNTMKIAAVWVLVTWLATLGYFAKTRNSLPLLRHQSVGMVSVIGVLGLVLWLVGAEQVFNAVHVWIFPDNHQWFFYYQDSLMSTMMLAPTLFAWIAGAWLVLAIILFFGLHVAVSCTLKKITEA